MAPRSRAQESPDTRCGRVSRLLAGLLVLAMLLLGSGTASASPDTLRRSFGNMLMGPLDMLLSPVVGIMTTAENLSDVDDTAAVRVVYAVPGAIFLMGLDFGSGFIRTITGALEFVPGVLVFPFETDLDPLFDPVEDAPALVNWENPLVDVENPWVYYNPLVAPFAINVKFGINYTQSEF
ncbi:MAG: hypothetical protein VX252_06630 [Myxococcota bacterium]|nr:hypothetical protein [Myxococcota bacterium]